MTGTVRAKGGGPLAATVFIWTAGPKVGTSTFCPSCYADCAKHATADAAGHFKFNSLDPRLIFRILVAAKGYQPKFVSKVDPAKGPVSVELEPIAAASLAPDRSLRGRVVDADGTPVSGAAVVMQGIQTRAGGGSWGALAGIDPLAVTDKKGDFVITAKRPFDLMEVEVQARGFANKLFGKLASGTVRHVLKITEGATLKGRVLFHEKPLGGVQVGISGVDREAGVYVGNFEVGTATNGEFIFFNLPPNTDYYLYGIMSSMKQFGAIPVLRVHSGKDGQVTDTGDLLVGPAHRLAGRVVLSDHAAVPAHTRLLIGRDKAWDAMQLTLDQDGRFDTPGIPSGEAISLSVRVPGYHVSTRNPSLDRMNPFQLVGHVDRDITNLVFLMDPGKAPQPNYNGPMIEAEQPRNLLLRGAESPVDHSMEWKISGRVLDSESKQAISAFTVMPGLARALGQTSWDTVRAVHASNGMYQVYVSKRFAQPLLKVEADGYLPASVPVLPRNANNVDFQLQKGSGPSGTVVTKDGTPAKGVSVVLLDNGFNQANLNSQGELSTGWSKSWDKNSHQESDADGKFSFKPELDMVAVAAASSNGFSVVSVSRLAKHPVIQLKPYGRISGILQGISGPGTNHILDVAFIKSAAGDAAPGLNLNNHCATDSKGHFEFDHVPPGHINITCRVPVNQGSAWMTKLLREVEVKPDQSLTLTLKAPKQIKPPAVSFRPPPGPKRVPGVEVEGVVLAPNGKPAAEAEVALQVQGAYLSVGKATFASANLRDQGMLVNTGPDGKFALPMFERTKGVVALSRDGFAEVSLGELKSSPRIKLQKWGAIEGTLKIGHRPASNTTVVVESEMQPSAPLFYDRNAFQARTDEKGRFIINYVPPGKRRLARMVPVRPGSSTDQRLGTVDVKAGGVTHVNLGGDGRTVIGKATLPKSSAHLDFTQARGWINAPIPKILRRFQELKSPEERRALAASKEFKDAAKKRRKLGSLPVVFSSDGTFRAKGIRPGRYELTLQFGQPPVFPANGDRHISFTVFQSESELVIPPFKDKNDDTCVQLGTVALKERTISRH